MGASTGIGVIGDYATPATDALKVQALLDLIPNPDAPHGSGAMAVSGANGVTNTYLDEMSPGAAAQLRAELLALKASVAAV